MGVVLEFPLQPIDPERVRLDGDERCQVLVLPVTRGEPPDALAQALALCRAALVAQAALLGLFFRAPRGDPPDRAG